MKNKGFMIAMSLALILAGILGIFSVVKGSSDGGIKACSLNQTITCNTGSITAGVIGTLQSGGIITGIVALFVVALGAVILINSMKSE